MKLVIQIPCYNEERTLTSTLNDLPKKIDGIDTIEYLIIDDGSTDRTVEAARNWGVDHIVQFKDHKGLADGFMAGVDECLRCGADIVVNTDADNQYCGEDVETIVRPIIEGKADIVIGERPIDEMDFSFIKKEMQHLGSWVVRKASKTNIPDAASGFRAYSRDAAMKLNVVNRYTYTLEQIVQAGRTGISITSVPIHTNKELRESRLSHGMFDYIWKSVLTIGRAYMMYSPLRAFFTVSLFPILFGLVLGIRYLIFYLQGYGSGHVQSLLLAVTMILVGGLLIVVGLIADMIAANRKILQEIQYRARKLDYETEYRKRDREEASYGDEGTASDKQAEST